MKATTKAKFLMHLSKRKQEEGFTLIELLVVIIIIGILSAIALPSFLNQANKARQSEAKTYVGSMNRAQQAYRLENTTFAEDFTTLALGIKTETTYFDYKIENTGKGSAVSSGVSQDKGVKSYVGGVQLVQKVNEDATTVAVLCENLKADNVAAAPPDGLIVDDVQTNIDALKCAASTKALQ